MQLFPGCAATSQAITVIHPGDHVPPHTDNCAPEWITRVHVPIVTNKDSWFRIDGKKVHMDAGSAYRFNPSKPHS